MKEVENKFKEHIELYTNRCTNVFKSFIRIYRIRKFKTENRLECICEVFDSKSICLTFMDFPDMSNHGQVLDDVDEKFMKNTEFMNQEFHNDFMSYLTEYIEHRNINEDEYDVYEKIVFPILVAWLSQCWTAANKATGTTYNLFFFEHRYFNQPAVNLLNQETVFLADLVTRY